MAESEPPLTQHTRYSTPHESPRSRPPQASTSNHKSFELEFKNGVDWESGKAFVDALHIPSHHHHSRSIPIPHNHRLLPSIPPVNGDNAIFKAYGWHLADSRQWHWTGVHVRIHNMGRLIEPVQLIAASLHPYDDMSTRMDRFAVWSRGSLEVDCCNRKNDAIVLRVHDDLTGFWK
ncbi:hypothetical protein L2E82_09188 [Cichorium intybus]|uniref:Uncharacterized protein n=1 Tax=Cichorium intybus TaxID=13427 RepID=A0ACB9G7N7_CICIN|nr:hypothetical protein L2E82_09188 [Cichorium intybus]